MLVLVILQIETLIDFVFNLRIQIVPAVTRIICKLIEFQSKEIQDLLGQFTGRS